MKAPPRDKSQSGAEGQKTKGQSPSTKLSKDLVLTCKRTSRAVTVPATAEAVAARDHLTDVPIAKADTQDAERVAEDVAPEVDVDGVALLIFLPALWPQSRMFDEVIKKRSGELCFGFTIELRAKLVTLNGFFIQLTFGAVKTDLLVVDVEVVPSFFEFVDLVTIADKLHFTQSSVKRELTQK